MTVLTPTRKCRFWAEIGMALVWNRFEQVRIKILTFKFELKSHFIMIQNLKMLKYLQLRLLQNRSFRISFFKITKFIKIPISKIRSSAKFQSAKLQKLQSSVLIRQQIRFCSLGWNKLWELFQGWSRGEDQIWVRVKNDKNRVFVRLYRGKPRLYAVESDWSAWSALNERARLFQIQVV